MILKNFVRPAAVVFSLAVATPVVAQTGGYGSSPSGASVTSTDIQRLQDQVYDAGNEVSRLRSRDQALADKLTTQLDDLRDEVIYLRVKLRKEGSVSRSDYTDVRGRIDSVRSQARTDVPASNDTARQGTGTWSGAGSGSGSGSGSGYGAGTSGSGSVSGGTTDAPRPATQTRRNEIPEGQQIDVRL